MSGSADGDLRTRTQFLGLTTEACGLLKGFLPVLEPRLPELLEGFYQHVTGIPALKQLLGERVTRLKRASCRSSQHSSAAMSCNSSPR
jgi:hypothetical protein